MDTKSDTKTEELKDLLAKLQESDIHLKEVYLFGSYLKREDYNDIDVALVSDDFSGVRFFDMKLIIEKLKRFSSIFDIHPFRTEEFYDEDNFFASEIKRTGKKFNWTS
jgi:predicted nucleotidyltransferase